MPRFPMTLSSGALRGYVQWAVDEVLSYGAEDARVPDCLAMPRWSWEGLESSAS
jgi:hemoglobin